MIHRGGGEHLQRFVEVIVVQDGVGIAYCRIIAHVDAYLCFFMSLVFESVGL